MFSAGKNASQTTENKGRHTNAAMRKAMSDQRFVLRFASHTGANSMIEDGILDGDETQDDDNNGIPDYLEGIVKNEATGCAASHDNTNQHTPWLMLLITSLLIRRRRKRMLCKGK